VGLVTRAGEGAYPRPGADLVSPQSARSALERAATEYLWRVDRTR
jgi:hypothetical protein